MHVCKVLFIVAIMLLCIPRTIHAQDLSKKLVKLQTPLYNSCMVEFVDRKAGNDGDNRICNEEQRQA